MLKLIIILILISMVLLESASAVNTNIDSRLIGNVTFGGGNVTFANQTFETHFGADMLGPETTIIHTMGMINIQFDVWKDPSDRVGKNLSI